MTTLEDTQLEKINRDKIVEYSPAIAFSAVIVALGIFGNILSATFYGFKTRKSVTNTLISALAFTDLITCLVLADEIIELCYTVTFRSVFGCKLMYFCNHWLVFCSALQLPLIAFDRYKRICKPLSWQFSMFSARVALACIIVGALVLSVRDWFILDVVRVDIMSNNHNETVKAFYCTHSKAKGGMQTAIKTFHLIDFTFFILVILANFILYGFVAKAIWTARLRTKKYSRNGQNANKSDSSGVTKVCDQETSVVSISDIKVTDKEISTDSTGPTPVLQNFKPLRRCHSYHAERKVSIMMMAVTIGSIASFVPYFIVNLAIKANSKTSEQEFNVGVQIALRSYMLNNAINPFLMGVFNREFKRFVKKLLCRCFNIV